MYSDVIAYSIKKYLKQLGRLFLYKRISVCRGKHYEQDYGITKWYKKFSSKLLLHVHCKKRGLFLCNQNFTKIYYEVLRIISE